MNNNQAPIIRELDVGLERAASIHITDLYLDNVVLMIPIAFTSDHGDI